MDGKANTYRIQKLEIEGVTTEYQAFIIYAHVLHIIVVSFQYSILNLGFGCLPATPLLPLSILLPPGYIICLWSLYKLYPTFPAYFVCFQKQAGIKMYACTLIPMTALL